jgi:hypothetical protein
MGQGNGEGQSKNYPYLGQVTAPMNENDLRSCTVPLKAGSKSGTGFLVAPGLVLTCEHVVRGVGLHGEVKVGSRNLGVLPHFRCKDQAAWGTSQGSTRALSSSNPARPYIWRLMAFRRLICPSMGPLLHGVVIESSTAFKSRRSVLAN